MRNLFLLIVLFTISSYSLAAPWQDLRAMRQVAKTQAAEWKNIIEKLNLTPQQEAIFTTMRAAQLENALQLKNRSQELLEVLNAELAQPTADLNNVWQDAQQSAMDWQAEIKQVTVIRMRLYNSLDAEQKALVHQALREKIDLVQPILERLLGIFDQHSASGQLRPWPMIEALDLSSEQTALLKDLRQQQQANLLLIQARHQELVQVLSNELAKVTPDLNIVHDYALATTIPWQEKFNDTMALRMKLYSSLNADQKAIVHEKLQTLLDRLQLFKDWLIHLAA